MKETVKQLYKRCFDDSDAFVDYYFQHRYTDARNVWVERDGKVVAALQTLSYPMTFGGKLCSTAYLSAVCTDPDYRHQGVMKELVKKTHQALFNRGVWAATLIPAEDWLFVVYAKHHYSTQFFQEEVSYVIEQLQADSMCVIEDLTPETSEAVFAFFNEKLLERPYAIMHTEEDFKTLVGALFLDKGSVLVASTDGKISGVACVHPSSKILELVYQSSVEQTALLRAVGLRYHQTEVTYLVPPVSEQKKPLGMIRILAADKFLNCYASIYPNQTTTICVSDDELPENSGRYTLSNGICTKTELCDTDVAVWNMSQLADFLFRATVPHMSLMMNE